MTSSEIAVIIIAIPALVVIGIALVPVILAMICIVLGGIWCVGSLLMLPFAWLICKYNQHRDRQWAKREADELVQWRKDNPDAYEWARDNPGK